MATLKNTNISDTGFLQLPVGTTSQQPGQVGQPAAAAGQMRFNSDTRKVVQYNADLAAWIGTASANVIATGGTVYDVDVEGTTYRVHVFTSTGNSTFTVTRPGRVEYLIVAGGGGGGQNAGAGGGAGGLLTGSTTVTPQSYTVTVGAGGNGGTTSSCGTTANNGGNSTAFGLTAVGGGGGTNSGGNGASGGSGGGGGDCSGFSTSGANRFGGNGTAGQGNRGGDGTVPGGSERTGGGGGGAGSDGQATISASQAGAGGTGISSSIIGINVFYAGGGGGAVHSGTDGIGGLGGGGSGSSTESVKTGLPNTGGGGGGGRSPTAGGNGGSGIVVIRYPLRQENPVQAAGRVIGDGLVLDLDFANPTVYTGRDINDARLNGIVGILDNSPIFRNVRTHRSSLTFNGTNQRILFSQPPSTFLGSPFGQVSMECWLNASRFDNPNSDCGDRRSYVVTFYAGPGSHYDITTNTSGIYTRAVGGTNGMVTATGLATNTWYHVVSVISNPGLTLYVNAVNTGTSGSAVISQNLPTFRIAQGDYNCSNTWFQGEIGLVKIYNRALTAAEVSNNFNATRWRFGV
jgi:hypothetical protein